MGSYESALSETIDIINLQKELIEQQRELIHDLGEIIKTYGPPKLITFDQSGQAQKITMP
jgi:hypothetical protein